MLDATQRNNVTSPNQAKGNKTATTPTPSGRIHSNWAVIHTHPQAELWAVTNCTRLGYHCYLPTFIANVRDRVVRTMIHNVERPLFTSYAFVAIAPAEPWTPIRYAGGVKSLLMMDGKPAYAPTAAVEAIQASAALRRTLTPPNALWSPGAPCRLVYGGALDGAEGVIEAIHADNQNARVAVMMFGALRSVHVSLSYLAARG